MRRRPKVTVTAAVEPEYETPTCPKCGEACTASRADYDMTGRPSVTETMEPCGCTVTFPLPTRAQHRAAGEIEWVDSIHARTPARTYALVTGLWAVVAGLAAVALVWSGLRLPWGLAQTWNTSALAAALSCVVMYGRLWRLQRFRESALMRLAADDEDTAHDEKQGAAQ